MLYKKSSSGSHESAYHISGIIQALSGNIYYSLIWFLLLICSASNSLVGLPHLYSPLLFAIQSVDPPLLNYARSWTCAVAVTSKVAAHLVDVKLLLALLLRHLCEVMSCLTSLGVAGGRQRDKCPISFRIQISTCRYNNFINSSYLFLFCRFLAYSWLFHAKILVQFKVRLN